MNQPFSLTERQCRPYVLHILYDGKPRQPSEIKRELDGILGIKERPEVVKAEGRDTPLWEHNTQWAINGLRDRWAFIEHSKKGDPYTITDLGVTFFENVIKPLYDDGYPSIGDTIIKNFLLDNTTAVESTTKQRNPAERGMIYTQDDFLEDVFMDEYESHVLLALLEYKKNIIIQGAPGVGKTFLAKRLAYSMIEEKDEHRVRMVQFHQSYTYEDFILGYRPSKAGFELARGPFYEFCKDAENDPEHDYCFIIDEINRGNLSKIFGELLTLIENDKRGEKLRILYTGEFFSVPPNVCLIGLMNTADRSLAMIDYALRRRFAFFEIEPAFESEGFKKILDNVDSPKLYSLIEVVKELNEAISQDESLGKGFRIGHSYFCMPGDDEDIWLEHLVKYELCPILDEYWFDDREQYKTWSDRLNGAIK